MAISKTELDSLMARPARDGGHVLSVYLNVDQSRTSNLNRGYLRTLKERLRTCEQHLPDENERKSFSACAERVVAHVSNYGARARVLVLFCDGEVFWDRALNIPIESTLRWEEKPYLRPLLEAIDEYERYGVVLVDREKARLFTVHLGKIEEHSDVLSEEKRKYHKATSKDATRSQPNLQRREDEHTLWHLKEVGAAVEAMAARNGFDRLMLAGPHQITAELQGLLSKKVQAMVVRSMPLPIDSGEQAVLKETMRIEEEVERATEADVVERLITAAAKESHGALGLQPTLDAMRLGRIQQLIYVYDLTAEGAQCTKCRTLFGELQNPCPFCGGTLRGIPDIVGRLADLVVSSGGHAENVRGPAADRLREKGRIGAILRF